MAAEKFYFAIESQKALCEPEPIAVCVHDPDTAAVLRASKPWREIPRREFKRIQRARANHRPRSAASAKPHFAREKAHVTRRPLLSRRA